METTTADDDGEKILQALNENQKLASAEDDDDENSDSKGHEDDENVRDEVHLIECLEDSVILDDQ